MHGADKESMTVEFLGSFPGSFFRTSIKSFFTSIDFGAFDVSMYFGNAEIRLLILFIFSE